MAEKNEIERTSDRESERARARATERQSDEATKRRRGRKRGTGASGVATDEARRGSGLMRFGESNMSRSTNRRRRTPPDAGTGAVSFVPESSLADARRRTRFDAPPGQLTIGTQREEVVDVLAYALPPEPWKNDDEPLVVECDGLNLHCLPLEHDDSGSSAEFVG